MNIAKLHIKVGKLALAACLLMLCAGSAWATTNYFGYVTEGGGGSYGYSGLALWNNSDTFTCPGSGTQTLLELGVYAYSAGGTPGHSRVAIYTSDGTLIAQGSAEITVSSVSYSWITHTTFTNSAGNPVTPSLTGGTNYILNVSIDSSDTKIHRVLGGTNTFGDKYTDYTGGFPASLPATTEYSNYHYSVRAGVAAAAAATYYIDTSMADDNGSGITPATAWKTISKVNASSFNAGDIILFKRGCTWGESLTLPSNGSSGTNITVGDYGSYSSYGPILTGNGTTTLDTNSKSFWTFNHITFDGAQQTINAGTDFTFNQCIIKNSTARGALITTVPNVVYNNCVFSRNYNEAVRAAYATTTVTLKNCIVVGNAWDETLTGLNNYDSSSSITYTNSLITGNGLFSSKNIGSTGMINGGNNLVEYSPQLLMPVKNKAYFVMSFDDIVSDYFLDVATVLEGYGFRGTFFMYSSDATVMANMVTLAGRGHEIGVHSLNHSSLGITNMFQVTTTNSDPVINIDTTAKTLVLTTSTGGNNVTLDWSSTAKTITNLKAAVSGKGWTITNTANVSNGVTLDGLASSGGNKTTFPYDAPISNQYWSNEIIGGFNIIAANIGSNPTTIAYPYGTTNTALQTWIKDNTSLIGARGVDSGIGKFLSSINIWDIKSSFYTFFIGDGSENIIRTFARHVYNYAINNGYIFTIYSHTTAQMSPAQVGWFVDEVQKAGGIFYTFTSAISSIRSDHSTSDGITYTKTYPDVSDFHLQSGSPAKAAGVPILTYAQWIAAGGDMDGKNPTGGTFSIGAYQFQKKFEVDFFTGTILKKSRSTAAGSYVQP